MEGTYINARVKYTLYTSVVVITTILSVWLMIVFWDEIAELTKFKYLGVFIIAFIAGSSIPTPISYLLVTFAMGGSPSYFGAWNPALIGLCGGVGAGTGGTLVFYLGRGGRRLLPALKDLSVEEQTKSKISNRLISKFNQWAHKRGSIVVFLMSAMLNPVFAPMAVAMGALRFKAIKFFIMCTAGNIFKAVVIAYAGYLGIGFIQRLFS
jgi:membrane protein DedA with SNARE-associated domain